MDKIKEHTWANFLYELKSINLRLSNLKYHEPDFCMDRCYDRASNAIEYLMVKYEEKIEEVNKN